MNNEVKILEMLTALTETVNKHGEMLTALTETVNKHGEMLTALTETVSKHGEMLSKLDERVSRLDERFSKLGERVEELDKRSLRTAVLLECDIAPKVQLLFEGQQNLADTLAPKSRVEKLEEDMTMMKDVIKLMRIEINDLKKAQ